MPFPRPLLCVLLLVASAATATPAPAPATKPANARADQNVSPNVILITIDTARADRMGFLGSTRGLTPNLDALARQSVVFTHAYSQVPLTTASHATILTGTYPQFNQVNDFGVALAPELPYAPDILHARGYHTAAFVGSLILDPQARSAPGFERGFDTYDSGFHRRRPGEDRYQSIERRGTEVVAHALAWLSQHPKGPFFLWIHLYDPHDPYDPPDPFKARYASAPYDGEIAYTDFAVGKLLSQLRLRGLYQGSLIAVMSDHGEALGDHGELTHGIFLYDETVHVPLLLKLPAGRSAGKRVEARARLVDVLPTILETAGIPIPSAVQGESLLSLITPSAGSQSASSGPSHATSTGAPDVAKANLPPARPTPDRPAYSESDYPHRTFGWSSLRSLRTGKYLFVEAPHPELYDQSSDPKAEHNLAGSSSAVTNTLSSQLAAFRQQTATSKDAPQVVTDPDLQEKLAALGYVASDTTSAPMPGIKETDADPKERIEIVNLMHRAEMLAEGLHYQDAVPLLQQVIAKEPGLPIAYLQLGTAYSILGNYEKAVPVLRQAVHMRPDLVTPRYQLGTALFQTGDLPGAIAELETSIARSPRWPEPRFTLATAYARSDRLPDAIREYRQVIELRPKHYAAHLLLGRALTLSGNPQDALAPLTAAAELQPASPEPHAFLADTYMQLGREADATRERAEAERLRAAKPAAAKP